MKCPGCGARNPERAAWCSQCYLPLRETGEHTRGTAVEVDPHSATGPAAAATAANPPRTDRPAASPASDGRFRRVGDGLEWRCGACERWNALDAAACATCGRLFGAELKTAEPVRHVPASTALLASAVLPGAGHVLLGRLAAGIARAATYLLWVAGGWLLLRAATAADQPPLAAAPLLAGALAVWAGSARDAVVLAEGRGGEVLHPRAFLWLVVGVVSGLLLAFVGGVAAVS